MSISNGNASLGAIAQTFAIGLVVTPVLALATTLVAGLELLLWVLALVPGCGRRSRTRSPNVVLITGASSGIGAALARRYAKAGRTLLLTGRNESALKETATACIAAGASVHSKIVDVASDKGRGELRAWIKERAAQGPPIDLVMANAGVTEATSGAAKDDLEDSTRRVFDTNVSGVFATVFPALEGMRARGAGQVALVSSLAGFGPLSGSAAYAASKAAVKSLGESLRWQLMREGISVNVIAPGYVESAITKSNAFPMPGIMTAGAAVEAIVTGLANDDAVIVFPTSTFLQAFFSAAFAPVLRDFLARNRIFAAHSYWKKSKAKKSE